MADLPVVVALYEGDIRLAAEPFCPGELAPIACEKNWYIDSMFLIIIE